jgi:ribosomal RNA assembly protein
MSFEYNIKLPLDRIGVLIGKDGNVKSMIEKHCNVKLDIDSEYGDVIIKGTKPIEKMEPFKAVGLVTAIARGFSPEKAMQLLDDNIMLQVIDLKEYGRSRSNLERIKGRIIGSNGKTRRLIEEYTDTDISVYGHYVSIIGKFDDVRVASEAIIMIINGSAHKSVYAMLDNNKKRQKLERLKLWEDKYED